MSLIDADICKAQTLPSRFYTDAELFDEIVADFSTKWHFAAHLSQLTTLMPIDNPLSEPMVLVTSEKTLCLSNVCTHRGMIVCNSKDEKKLQCPYHGRTFNLDGTFRNMPEFDTVENFPSPADDLPSFPLEEWKGLLFNSCSASKFDDYISIVSERMNFLDIESFFHDEEHHREHEVNCNWALYVENYLEGFHIPFVHADLHAVLDYEGYRTELYDYGVLQIGIAKEGEDYFDLPEGHIDEGLRVAAYYFWLYPGLMFNFYPWGLSVNLVIPEAVDRTRVIYHRFTSDAEANMSYAIDKIEAEDQFIVERVQKGMESSSYDRGRYSPKMETGPHHFHRILADTIGHIF